MKDEHDILKEELTRGIDLDKIYQESGGKPIPTYKKLAGLVNLGKTYFINFGEVRKAHDWAQTQMTNKYGAELYGVNAQLAQQRNDGTGNILDGRSSLITCNVSTMYNLPKDGFVKEASGEYLDFKNTLEKFDKFLKDRDWDKDHTSDYNDFAKIADEFNVNLDGDSDVNKKAWGDFMKLMKKEPWKSNLVKGNKLYDHFKQLKLAYDQWDIGGSAKGSKDELFGRASGDSGNGWMPLVTCKIDVRTNFGEEWFKRKFKSGILNKMIYAIKTDAMSRAHKTGKEGDMAGHKYSADQMEPSDKRKLDSLQWKMTNKVAKDYISMLLGWSRKKEYTMGEDGTPKPTEELKPDEAFGAEMAKKALNNRGILGRLKQKILSGGQSNNVISVAFQMADWNDGWTKVQPKEETEPVSESQIDDMIMESILKGE